jgi:hypothetical protein
MLLVTHVLQAIPIYHAMFLQSTTKVIQQLTLLCREFLWGRNLQGGKRIPLVAWSTMACPKAMGGLGFKDFKTHSDALLSKWVLKALKPPDSEWAQLFGVNLQKFQWRNNNIIRRHGYSVEDLILLGTPSSFLKLAYTGSLWKAWTALRDFLIFYPDRRPIPGHWSVEDLARVLNEIQLASSDSILELAAVMGRIGCRRVSQMWEYELHTWKDLNYRLARVRGLTNESLSFVQSFLRKIANDTVDEQHATLSPGHWRWSDQSTKRMETFILPNRRAYLFLFPQDFTHQRLNSI